jgi:hypothetical protein
MSNQAKNVQKLDVQLLDAMSGARGQRLINSMRKFKLDLWTGPIAGAKAVATVERHDARL